LCDNARVTAAKEQLGSLVPGLQQLYSRNRDARDAFYYNMSYISVMKSRLAMLQRDLYSHVMERANLQTSIDEAALLVHDGSALQWKLGIR
jgi:hypothetical protein